MLTHNTLNLQRVIAAVALEIDSYHRFATFFFLFFRNLKTSRQFSFTRKSRLWVRRADVAATPERRC